MPNILIKNLLFSSQSSWFNDMAGMNYGICSTSDGEMNANGPVGGNVAKKYKHAKNTKDGK